nr:reverse transcriptase domain-containing protein [Tanacetum cinerariifolium]
MVLTFADTHNMLAYLTKSDASEGFNQIIDFLTASSIKYALTVNPNIYVSCIKQFWSSVLVKKRVSIVYPMRRFSLNYQGWGKGFSRVDTPLFEGMIVVQQADDVADEGRIIASTDADEDVTLKDVADIAKEVAVDAEIEESADDDEVEPTKLQEVVEVVTTTKLITEVVTVASATIIAATTPLTAAAITTAPSAARRRKGVVIRDHEETATPSIVIHSEAKSKDKGKWILVEEPKPLKKQAQIEQDEAYSREKNMMIYLRNMAGFKMDYFKGMSYDDIHLIFKKKFNSNVAFLEKTREQMEEEESKALKRTIKSQAEKAAKKQKLDEEEIYIENNKPYYKIIREDRSPQLCLSFLSLLGNFDREDLEVLWELVKERFTSSKPKNFLDDFLLTTLTYMFEKPDVQAQVWKNQRTVHGLAKAKTRDNACTGVGGKTFCCQVKLMLLDDAAKLMNRYALSFNANSYHPQTSGQVEVTNRGLKRILERTVGENRASWSDKLEDALWAFRTAFKTSIGCTPYRLVYGKACHLPLELKHKAYWALKHANFNLKIAGDHRKLQLNELNELRDQAYENSLIYKERTKKLHDDKIKNRIFSVGDQVLLFNSRLKIFSGKLKSRWSGPFTISEIYPYGTAKLIHPDGCNFKVDCHRLKHYHGGDPPPLEIPDVTNSLRTTEYKDRACILSCCAYLCSDLSRIILPKIEDFLCRILSWFSRPSYPLLDFSLGKSLSVIYIAYSYLFRLYALRFKH